MKLSHTLPAFLGALLLTACSTTPTRLDERSSTVLQQMSDKLAAAKSLRFTAVREASPGFVVGVQVPERATITGAVIRPGKMSATSVSSLGRRTVTFDGSSITLVDREAGTHASVEVAGDLDAAVEEIGERYGYLPPLAELLVNQPASFLLKNVTSADSRGTVIITGLSCEHIVLHQDGLTCDLWIETATHLPRRIRVTYPDGEGSLSSTATITSLKLDAPVSDAELKTAIPARSRKIEMVPLGE